MYHRLRQITPPTGNIITLDDVKAWLSESSTHSDDIINDIIATTTKMLDGEHSIINSTVLPTTWELSLWSFPYNGQMIELPLPPVISVDSFEYDNDAGTTTIVSKTFTIDDNGLIYVASHDPWPTDLRQEPSVEPIRIQYRAGYDTATPAPIRQCALAMCSHMFDNRSKYQGSNLSAVIKDPAIHTMLASYNLA